MTKPLRVLVTGAYGLIGNLVFANLARQAERYVVFGTSRRTTPSKRTDGAEVFPIPEDRLRVVDLTDLEGMRRAVEGMDVVVHMAADPSGISGWESVHSNNIIGTYNMFEASREAGVKRVLYASSNQVAFGYRDRQDILAVLSGKTEEGFGPVEPKIDHTMPTRPLNLYSCSKVFGEGLSHMYASTTPMSVIVLRFGWVLAADKPPQPYGHSVWCSQRDCVQFVEKAILAPSEVKFDIFFVHSQNEQNFVDIQHGMDVLGYLPEDGANPSGTFHVH